MIRRPGSSVSWAVVALVVTAAASSSMPTAGAQVPTAGTGQGPRSPTYSQVILDDQPSMYWRLGDPAGRTALDSSGNGRDARYRNGAHKGKPGAIVDDPDTAARLDGIDDCVRWQADTPYTGAFSAEAWVSSNVRGVQDQGFLSTRGRILDYSFDIKLEDSDSSGYGVRVDVGNGTQWMINETIGFAWKANRWYHIVGVASLSSVTIYVDGKPIGTRGYVDSGPPFLFDADHPVQIGRASHWESPFSGRIDEAAIYEYALTPQQVAAHYAAGVGP